MRRAEGRDGHEIAQLRRGTRVAPRIIGRGATVRAAFVPTQAGPLAGDEDRIRIVVGAGAALVVEPVAATLALPGAARTLLALDITVEAGGRLVLDEAPLVVAAGAHVVRRTTIALASGAVVALREAVVLGRAGEEAGMLDSVMRVTVDGAPLLHDGLRLGPCSSRLDAHVALAPGHRVVASACLLGIRPDLDAGEDQDSPIRVLALAGPGAVARATATSLAPADADLAGIWQAWSRAAIARAAGVPAQVPVSC